ncbi:hypothetical protein [Deinococcus actinosclerus]|uniref:hypothetical protein n=1 Tax=Deinococcus actinosclerus TaxID=1768108 RepID=UPI0012FBF3E3|nr:hypothetical protein [Deinococcus actinosclerus]
MLSEMRTTVYEFNEKLESKTKDHDGEIKPAFLVSVGPESMVNDLCAIATFVLGAVFSPDRDLVYRLTRSKYPSIGRTSPVSKLVKRIFDEEVSYSVEDSDRLKKFLEKLISLPRKKYEAVMRSICRFVTGIHRMGDDLDVAYTIIVASLESLARDFSDFEAGWESLEGKRRSDLDKSMADIPDEKAQPIREAILKHEYLGLSRRYREFVLSNIDESFFREEAVGVNNPIGRPQLESALRGAYAARSKYVHELQDLPKMMVTPWHESDLYSNNGESVLTFRGIIRVARKVITKFVEDSESTGYEDFDYTRSYPNIVIAEMAPEYWIHLSEGFNHTKAKKILSGFLDISTALVAGEREFMVDVRGVLQEIQKQAKGIDVEKRRPMLLMYFIYHFLVHPDLAVDGSEEFLENFTNELDTPHIESVVANTFVGEKSEWEPSKSFEVWEKYMKQRMKPLGLQLNRRLETAIILRNASMCIRAKLFEDALRWIKFAVENDPGKLEIIEIENKMKNGVFDDFEWQKYLFKDPATAEKDK